MSLWEVSIFRSFSGFEWGYLSNCALHLTPHYSFNHFWRYCPGSLDHFDIRLLWSKTFAMWLMIHFTILHSQQPRRRLKTRVKENTKQDFTILEHKSKTVFLMHTYSIIQSWFQSLIHIMHLHMILKYPYSQATSDLCTMHLQYINKVARIQEPLGSRTYKYWLIIGKKCITI